MFGPGVYEIKIIRDGNKAGFLVDGETIGVVEDVERNTIGLWNWGGGLTSIKDIYLKEGSASPRDPVAPPSKFVDISVTVTDGKDPVESATVTLTSTGRERSKTGTTGSAGGCTLRDVEPGTYVVTATAEGYNSYTAAEYLVVTGNTSLNIVLTKTN